MEKSLVAFRTTARFEETALAVGTSFIYSVEGRDWLVTAWHMVSGRHNLTGTLLSEHGGVPDSLVVRIPIIAGRPAENLISYGWTDLVVGLYADAERRLPRFLWHPQHHEAVDVVALPWTAGTAASNDQVAARAVNTDGRRLKLSVSMDAYVLGFPRAVSGAGELPIWKRASIASEPEVSVLNPRLAPMFYVDTATRQGMSGGPVLVRLTGFLPLEVFEVGHQPPEPILVGTVTTFAGLYSGRVVGEDEMAAQLGIVWTERAILETIKGSQAGTSFF